VIVFRIDFGIDYLSFDGEMYLNSKDGIVWSWLSRDAVYLSRMFSRDLNGWEEHVLGAVPPYLCETGHEGCRQDVVRLSKWMADFWMNWIRAGWVDK